MESRSGCMEAINVSPEMLTLLGSGVIGDRQWPTAPVAFEFDFSGPATFRFHRKPQVRMLDARHGELRLVFLVARSACERLLGSSLELSDAQSFFLPAELRGIALAIRDCALPAAVATPYRLAKSIELLCELLQAHASAQLTPTSASAGLSQLDQRRIAAARQLIDAEWSKKLTLNQIARQCGLNRSKLSRGFRDLYRCSVTEALAERRLSEARRQLLATDLPVSLIGYRSGYLNNASFTRAFGRRFGVSPTGFRACAMAA